MEMWPGTELILKLTDMDKEEYVYICTEFAEQYNEQPFSEDVEDYEIDEVLEYWLWSNFENYNYGIRSNEETVEIFVGLTNGYCDRTSISKVEEAVKNMKDISRSDFVNKLFKTQSEDMEIEAIYS